jgi:flagellar hook assembly protein FlgD
MELGIYDLAVRMIHRRQQGAMAAGEHHLTWNGLDDTGRRVAPGVYLVRLRTGPRVVVPRYFV